MLPLLEGDDRLILVDTGLGVEDVNNSRRLIPVQCADAAAARRIVETALRQVADLGFRPDDVRHIVPTHLDLDHAGGMGDFPARRSCFRNRASRRIDGSSLGGRARYRAVQIASKKWAPVEADGEAWFGFEAVRAEDSRYARRGAAGPASGSHARPLRRRRQEYQEGWLFHCGDAYFHHSEVTAGGAAAPPGLRFYEALISVDNAARLANQARLRDLAQRATGEVRLPARTISPSSRR